MGALREVWGGTPAGALAALRGNRVETFTYELHRQVPPSGPWQMVNANLQLVRDCTIQYDRLARIKRTADFRVVDDGSTINFLTDAIRVKWNVRSAVPGSTTYSFPMGTFYMNSPRLPLLKAGRLREVTCYDSTVAVDQAKRTDWLTVPATDNVSITVLNILTADFPRAGIIYPLDPTVFGAAKVFEAGMSELDVVNRMLAYIGYDSLRSDVNGSFVTEPYVRPSLRTLDFIYSDDATTYPNHALLIGDAQVFEQDVFDAPTDYVRTVSRPGVGAPYPLISQYHVPASSPFSSESRGRAIVDYAAIDVASQAVLDDLTKGEAEEMVMRHTNLHFKTPLMPHDWGEVLAIFYSRMPTGYDNLKWIERSWTFPCVPGGVMEHVAETAISAA